MKRDPIERIEDGLRGLGAEHEPPAGWEQRVLDATAPNPRSAWRVAREVVTGLAVGIAVGLVLAAIVLVGACLLMGWL